MITFRTTWTAVNSLLAGAAFFFAVKLSPLAPVFITLACIGFLGQAWFDSRRVRKATAAIIPAVPDGMPAMHEIEASVRRLRRILESNGDLAVPDPPNGVDVICEACKVTEHYIYSSNAAESTHLLTHPERCRVNESEHGAPWLLKPFEARNDASRAVNA